MWMLQAPPKLPPNARLPFPNVDGTGADLFACPSNVLETRAGTAPNVSIAETLAAVDAALVDADAFSDNQRVYGETQSGTQQVELGVWNADRAGVHTMLYEASQGGITGVDCTTVGLESLLPEVSAQLEAHPVSMQHAKSDVIKANPIVEGLLTDFLKEVKVVDDDHVAGGRGTAACQRVLNQRAAMLPGEYPIHDGAGSRSEKKAALLKQSLGSAFVRESDDGLYAIVDLAVLSAGEALSAVTLSLTRLEHKSDDGAVQVLRRLTFIGRVPESVSRGHMRIIEAARSVNGYCFLEPPELEAHRLAARFPLPFDVLQAVARSTSATKNLPYFVQRNGLETTRRLAELPLNKIKYNQGVMDRALRTSTDEAEEAAAESSVPLMVLADAGEGDAKAEAAVVRYALVNMGGYDESLLTLLVRTAPMVGIDVYHEAFGDLLKHVSGGRLRGCVWPWLEGAAEKARMVVTAASIAAPWVEGQDEQQQEQQRALPRRFARLAVRIPTPRVRRRTRAQTDAVAGRATTGAATPGGRHAQLR